MSIGPLPHQSISAVSANNSAQLAAGTFYGPVQFGSTRDPQGSPAGLLKPRFSVHQVATDIYISIEALEKKVSTCRNALFLTDPHVDRESLISAKGTRVAGTCKWITQNGSYQSWLHDGPNILWICGGPGKGKTMLSIFLTEELERVTQNMEDAELVFYFCSHQDEKRNTAVAILRGLVHQIITKRPKLAKHVLQYLETEEMIKQTLSSLETLWIMFRRLVQDVDLGTIFCVLDGLDESDESTLRVLVPNIVNMFSPEGSQLATKSFRLIIVSRDIPGLRGCAQVKLDPDNEEQVTSDIERFISVKVEELSRIEGFNEGFRTTIQETLLKRSEGTFLWVGFVMTELSTKTTCTEMLETLDSLPIGLPAIYSRMLLQIKPGQRRTSSMILCWVMMTARALTVQELGAAIGVQSPSLSISTEQAVRDQVTFCGNFLKVQEQVDLVHQSARDYLLRKEPDSNAVLEGFRIKPEEAHFVLARTCFDCIAHSGLQYVPLDLDDESCSQESPLLKYAVVYWPEHARRCSTLAAELINYSGSFFENDSSLRRNWWEAYIRRIEVWLGPDTPSLLHMACYLGIVSWVQVLLHKAWIRRFYKRGASVNAKDNDGWTALHWAALGGHEAVVKLLLEKGAELESKNKNGWTPLLRAARDGHEAVVKLLLEKGAELESKDTDGRTALHWAALGGHEAVVKLLLEKGAELESKDTDGWTPLLQAAAYGREAVVRLLLEKGAELESKNTNGRTPLLRAAAYGHEAVVKLLLEKGAELESKDTDGWTPLLQAAAYGREAVVKLLLEKGAELESKNTNGWTPLSWAAGAGREAVVRLLLEKGAELESKNTDGWTPLLQAAAYGREAVVKLLLEKGAELESKDTDGRTPLSRAAGAGHEAVVRLLLEKGAELESKDTDGRTPLSRAAAYGREAVVKLLLEKGAELESKDTDGRTPLSWAAAIGREAVVKLLTSIT